MFVGIKDLQEKVCEVSGRTKKESKEIILDVITSMEDLIVEKGSLTLSDFLSFKVVERKGRDNLKLFGGETVKVEPYKAVSITVGRGLKEKVNKK